MTEAEYIASVLRTNPLRETADHLIQSGEEAYYADRHVEIPPLDLPRSVASSAGFALLAQWTEELEGILQQGLFAEGPLLIIDESWLKELPDSPPPHVVLTLGVPSTGCKLGYRKTVLFEMAP